MTYKEIPPPAALADIVRYFWVIESDDVQVMPLTYRLFAESSPGLVFFYHHNYGLVSGIQDQHREFMMSGKLGMMGAFLFPYALPLLFNLSADALTNRTVEISDLFGSEGLFLKEEVVEASTTTQRVEIIGAYLLKKTNDRGIGHDGLLQGVREIVRVNGVATIDSLIAATGVSARQLDRRFMSSVGISPKMFSRLVRFQASLQLPQKRSTATLTELALEAGYYDQSHFIRDFKTFSGISPGYYFRLDPHHAADNFVQMTA